MDIEDDGSLDAATWLRRMGRFVEGLAEGEASPARHIRQAYHLHCLAPDALKPLMPAPLEEARLEAMLERGAYVSAAASLVGLAGVRNGAPDPEMAIGRYPAAGGFDARDADQGCPIAVLETWAASFLCLRGRPH